MGLTSDELIGKIIFDRYRIESKIGKGGRGEVYRATDLQLDGEVAVKRLRASVAENPQELRRFEKEPRVTHKLKGPYVIYVHAFSKDPDLGEYFSVMEYVPGGSLSELLDTTERMSISESLMLTLEICEALDWIHERGVVHRDLKPANILITRQTDKFPIKLADFGIAYQCDEPEERIPQGTPWYASPEQLTFDENSQPLDSRSDLYSLGIILYEMLTGDPPFQGSTFDVFMNQIHDLPKPPKDFRLDLLPSLNDLILKALAKDPNERFQSARDMSNALKAVLAEEQARTEKLARLYPQAMKSFVEQKWDVAVERFSEIININPLYRDAQEKLESAQHEAQLAALHQKAIGLMEQKAWKKANEVLTELSQIAPYYQDVAQKLEKVNQEIRLSELYAKGKKFQADGDWTAAQTTYVQILTIDASYRDVANRLVETQRQQKLMQLYQDALEFIRQEEWDLAVGSLEQVTNDNPDYNDASAKLDYARKQAALKEFYSQGETYQRNRDWAHALDAYQNVVNRDPHYKEAAVMLVEVQKFLDRRTNYESGEAAMAAKNWEEAVRCFEAVQNIDPDYKDNAVKLEAARRQFNLETDYNEGLRYLELGEWKSAMEYLTKVIKQNEDYRDAARLLTQAQERARLDALASQAQELYQTGQWQDAIVVWGRVLEAAPNYPEAVRLQLCAKFAQAKELLEAQQTLLAIGLADEILKTDPDYSGAVQLKLDALFKQASVAHEDEQWQKALDTLNQLLSINPKYPKAAALRRSVVTSQRWDSVSRVARRCLVQFPLLTLLLLLLTCGLGSMLLWSQRGMLISMLVSDVTTRLTQTVIGTSEVLINGIKIDAVSPQLIDYKDEVEIKVRVIDTNGELIPSDEVSCRWLFIPGPEPTDFLTQDECTIRYKMPASLESQSVRGEAKGKDGTPITGVSRASVKFVLSRSE
jgi:serine/threonine protein kinase